MIRASIRACFLFLCVVPASAPRVRAADNDAGIVAPNIDLNDVMSRFRPGLLAERADGPKAPNAQTAGPGTDVALEG